MRRLPIFLLLDISESMAGRNRDQLQEGIGTIVANLRLDPSALETVHIGVIGFAGIARALCRLTELAAFRAPHLPIGGGTALGAALERAMGAIDREVIRPSAEHKGDWAPIVYLFTDGKPTDDVTAARTRWLREYAPRAALVAVAMGRDADQAVLRSLTDNVLTFDDRVPGGFDVFVRWVTDSVRAQSQRIGEPGGGIALAKPDDTVIAAADSPAALCPSTDPDCAVLVGRCQQTRKPYLLKYDRGPRAVPMVGAQRDRRTFALAGAYPIDEDYFAWSGEASPTATISTAELSGVAPCPHCGNQVTIARSGCDQMMCLNGPGLAVCPWCDELDEFVAGSEDFDVERRAG
jgi:uncharacterized protein YegL